MGLRGSIHRRESLGWEEYCEVSPPSFPNRVRRLAWNPSDSMGGAGMKEDHHPHNVTALDPPCTLLRKSGTT